MSKGKQLLEGLLMGKAENIRESPDSAPRAKRDEGPQLNLEQEG